MKSISRQMTTDHKRFVHSPEVSRCAAVQVLRWLRVGVPDHGSLTSTYLHAPCCVTLENSRLGDHWSAGQSTVQQSGSHG